MFSTMIAHFKNRFTLLNVCFMHTDYVTSDVWANVENFHGKDLVEAFEVTIKRALWRVMKARKKIEKDVNNV